MAKTKKTRWQVPLTIIILSVVVQLVSTRLVDNDGTLSGFIRMLIWTVSSIAIFIWWLCFSRLKWKIKLIGLGALTVVSVILLSLFRFEGMTGNFTPQFSSRIAKSKEDRAIEYFNDSDSRQSGSATDAILVTAADWPKFGGPFGDQNVQNQSIRTDWNTNSPKALWRHPVGAGWTSFSIVGELLFTQEQRGEKECVVCYQANTGAQLWVHEDNERFEESAGGPGPRATPTVHDSKLYSLGATGVLNCLNPSSGEVIWSTNIVDDNGGEIIEWALAGSPIIYEDLVLVNPGTSSAFLAAYDRLTGEKKWQGPKARAGYATPLVTEFDGVTQVVMFRAHGVGGYSIETGEELWFFEWTNAIKITVAQPMILPDKSLFISAGYGSGSALLDISRSGKDSTWTVKSRWERRNKFKLKFNGGIYRDGYIYGLDEGVLSCFDIKEGKRTWKKGRFGYGQVLMLDNQQLLILTERGEVVLLDVSPESMTELARFQAIEGKTWNHPVLNRGRLFVRNDREAACYDLRSE